MKKIHLTYCLLLFSLLCGRAFAQDDESECFAAWTFDVAQDWVNYYGMTFAPDLGYFPAAVLYANGSFGSSQFATYTYEGYFTQMIKTDWVGTTLGDPRSEQFDGYCLGFKHPSTSGRSFVIACPTSLYSKIRLRFAATRSNTGFKKMSFAWSLTGAASSYQHISSKPCDALDFEVYEMNLETYPQLENQPMIYLRVTIDSIGSTAYQGNIKFDNICLIGDKCSLSTNIYDSIYSGDSYAGHGFDCQAIVAEGDYEFSRRVHFDNACDSIYLLHLHVTDTTTVVPADTTSDVPSDTTSDNPSDTTANLVPELDFDNLVNVYPNPFSDVLYIEPVHQGQLFRRVVIYNSIGVKVEDWGLKEGAWRMSNDICCTKDWKPGIYYVHCFMLNGVTVIKKIIKW